MIGFFQLSRRFGAVRTLHTPPTCAVQQMVHARFALFALLVSTADAAEPTLFCNDPVAINYDAGARSLTAAALAQARPAAERKQPHPLNVCAAPQRMRMHIMRFTYAEAKALREDAWMPAASSNLRGCFRHVIACLSAAPPPPRSRRTFLRPLPVLSNSKALRYRNFPMYMCDARGGSVR